jgi:hypothetical protein
VGNPPTRRGRLGYDGVPAPNLRKPTITYWPQYCSFSESGRTRRSRWESRGHRPGGEIRTRSSSETASPAARSRATITPIRTVFQTSTACDSRLKLPLPRGGLLGRSGVGIIVLGLTAAVAGRQGEGRAGWHDGQSTGCESDFAAVLRDGPALGRRGVDASGQSVASGRGGGGGLVCVGGGYPRPSRPQPRGRLLQARRSSTRLTWLWFHGLPVQVVWPAAFNQAASCRRLCPSSRRWRISGSRAA